MKSAFLKGKLQKGNSCFLHPFISSPRTFHSLPPPFCRHAITLLHCKELSVHAALGEGSRGCHSNSVHLVAMRECPCKGGMAGNGSSYFSSLTSFSVTTCCCAITTTAVDAPPPCCMVAVHFPSSMLRWNGCSMKKLQGVLLHQQPF